RHHGHPRPVRRVPRRPGGVPGRRAGGRRDARADAAGRGRADDGAGDRHRHRAGAGVTAVFGIALQSARARWTSFAAFFLALALGATLLPTPGLTLASGGGGGRQPVWYDTADVVVAGPNSITVVVDPGTEDEYTATTSTIRAQSLPAGLATRLPGA